MRCSSSTKGKKTAWVFVFQKYSKFWSVLLGHFIKHKLLISEECQIRLFCVKSLLPLDLLEDFCSSKTFSILDTSGITFSEFEDKTPRNEKKRELYHFEFISAKKNAYSNVGNMFWFYFTLFLFRNFKNMMY